MIGRRELVGAALAAGALPLAGRALAQVAVPLVNSIALVGSRLLMAAKIGGHGPYFFAIDTGGAVNLLDVALARKLRMKEARGGMLVGVGGRSEEPWFNAGDLSLANGLRLPEMVFAGSRGGFGHEVVGTFGSSFFTNYDSELDFTKGQWRAYPRGRPDRTGWTKLKSRFVGEGLHGKRIFAEAAIDGYTGDFLIDSGAPGHATLDGPAAKASGLWRDDRPYAPVEGRGIGQGRPMRRLVRADKLRIGKFAFERPLVSLSTPGTGENHRHDGILGLKTLTRLNLASDVGAGALWVQASGVEPVDDGWSYSRSGIWFVEREGRTIVADVGIGSPARAAGVAAGDAMPGASLEQAVRSVAGPAGREVTLGLERGGAAREVKFTLADYL